MSSVGYATLSVIPSARNFGSALSRDIDPQMRAPGLSAGKVLGAGLVAGVAIAAAGIAAVLKTGIGEAMDASAGTAQLTAGIASTGNAANVTVGGLNSLASSIQAYSGQTDDSIVASEQLLLTFTNIRNTDTDKIFDRATAATADMAAKMGGDAAGSAIQLGKALNDPIAGMASLGRMGVQFTDAQKETIRSLIEQGDVVGAQNVILGELETQFGGAAAAAGQSLPGQLEIAKRSFEDVSQSVAEGLLPVVLPGLTSIGETITTTVIPAITGFIQGFKDGEGPGGRFRDVLTSTGAVLGDVAARVSTVVGWFNEHRGVTIGLIATMGALVAVTEIHAAVLAVTAAGGLAAYISQLGIVRAASATWAAVQWVVNAALTANPIGLVIIAIAALIAIIVLVVTHWDTVKAAGAAAWNGIKDAWSGAGEWFGGIGDAIKEAFRGAFNWVARGWNDTIGALSWTIPDWVPGIGGNTISVPNIPLLASGALVTGPTLAMIGEGNEPEAVLPLSKLDALLKSNANGRPGMTVKQYITTSDPEAAGIAGLRRIQALGA